MSIIHPSSVNLLLAYLMSIIKKYIFVIIIPIIS